MCRMRPLLVERRHRFGPHHLPALEDQMCEFTPDLDRSKPKRDSTTLRAWAKAAAPSPDRADALVWAADRIVAEVNNGGEMVEATQGFGLPHRCFTESHISRG